MQYRPEIDGLRAAAVIPVILSHAGFKIFYGGFIGVDIFFVISGFLITTILYQELNEKKISLTNFYERRARRILPALFIVMGACATLAYWSLLPHELDSFGQSLVATSLFSNNILLALTSGYWSLASEFKPLLHTWSLGVEEQYYVLIPLIFIFYRQWASSSILRLFVSATLVSLILAEIGSHIWTNFSFYLLPTRSWELLLGGIVAVKQTNVLKINWLNKPIRQAISSLGLLIVVGSVLTFGEHVRSPGLMILIPTMGAASIILFAEPNTWVYRILSSKPAVTIGLISYSAYLWHQPIFAYARVLSREEPTPILMGILSALTLPIAYFSWKWIETPFRQKNFIGQKAIFTLSALGIFIFSSWGVYLHAHNGLPERIFKASEIEPSETYIAYNERAFQFRSNSFKHSSARKVLVLGNSFARDFVNMNLESFSQENIEFVYSDEFPDCLDGLSGKWENLYSQADIIVYASGGVGAGTHCISANIVNATRRQKLIYYIGGKQFGYNLNWIARVPEPNRALLSNRVIQAALDEEHHLISLVPAKYFLSIYDRTLDKKNRIPITDEHGRLITPDRAHLTRYGAIYFGKRVLWNTPYESDLGNPIRRSLN